MTALAVGPKKHSLVPLIVTLALIFGISGTAIYFILPDKNESRAGQQNNTSATNLPAVKKLFDETVTNDLAVSALKLAKTTNSTLVYVTGTARNLAAQRRFGLRLTFGLFDTNQSAIGTASDYCQILEANGTWNFKALVLESKAAATRLDSVHEEK
jgi:hypothetical protein